jgi:hypothetical protein
MVPKDRSVRKRIQVLTFLARIMIENEAQKKTESSINDQQRDSKANTNSDETVVLSIRQTVRVKQIGHDKCRCESFEFKPDKGRFNVRNQKCRYVTPCKYMPNVNSTPIY